MAKERTPTGKELLAFAEAVDATTSWQFMGATGNLDKDNFVAYAISRGPILPIPKEAFGDIADSVSLMASEVEGDPRYIVVARFAGDVIGLHLFTESLTTRLDGGTEGETDTIKALGGPLFILGSVIANNQFSKDFF